MVRLAIAYVLGLLTLPLLFVIFVVFTLSPGRIFETAITHQVLLETETVDSGGFMADPERVIRLKHRGGAVIVPSTIKRMCFDEVGVEGFVADPTHPDHMITRYFNYVFRGERLTLADVPAGGIQMLQLPRDAYRPCDSEYRCMASVTDHVGIFEENWRAKLNCENR